MRYIFSEAVISKRGELIRKESKLNLEQNEDQIILLSDKIDQLDTFWKKSIFVCPVCGSRTSDMTFNPYDEYWYCTKCYGENQEFYKKRNEGYRYP
ncbi:MAG: hypothetical protein ACFFG0_39680 [Candidatus Thorarchaeota archaeon]